MTFPLGPVRVRQWRDGRGAYSWQRRYRAQKIGRRSGWLECGEPGRTERWIRARSEGLGSPREATLSVLRTTGRSPKGFKNDMYRFGSPFWVLQDGTQLQIFLGIVTWNSAPLENDCGSKMIPSFNCPVHWQWALELSEEETAKKYSKEKGSLWALKEWNNKTKWNKKPTTNKTLGIPSQI